MHCKEKSALKLFLAITTATMRMMHTMMLAVTRSIEDCSGTQSAGGSRQSVIGTDFGNLHHSSLFVNLCFRGRPGGAGRSNDRTFVRDIGRSRREILNIFITISFLPGESKVKLLLKHFLSRLLRVAYDKVLNEYDLLAMPTTAIKSQPIPAPDASREESFQRATEMLANTSPFDITHHPEMALPCGMSEGLPISLMLIGKHFDESTIYRAAHGFQEGTDWKKM